MIVVNLDVMLAKRKMSVTELSERVGNNDGEHLDFEEWQGEGGEAVNA